VTATAAADDEWEREADKLDNGLLTINQWRARQGLPPVAWGNTPWSPINKDQLGNGTATLEGEVKIVRHDNGMVEILDAPPVTRISLELIHCADPVTLKVTGRNITFGGQVVYEVTGWEPFSSALVAKLVEDRRPA
jgi:hypothetical protein